MKSISFYLVLLIFLSCGCNRTNKNEAAIKIVDNPVEEQSKFIDSQRFKVEKQTYFSLKEWNWEDRESKLTELNKEEVNKYFQAPLDSEKTYNTFYFFSIQENTPTRKSITILESDESCCNTLHLLTYDRNDKLVGKSIVAGSGGDGGWGYDAYGKFDSDSTYYFTHVELETIRDDSIGWEAEVDSLVVRFTVDRNLNFKQLSEKKFEYNKVHVSK
ncbi:hypothetical protein [Adhaeribacter pallidiroseus]|uniref:Lipoprotein n=1 Tax=Adhaeribacter pallidiroseus TaxID=2072847 RepID=A0A369QBZ3_9BACT|nr:hypothetical protein [Adhaeribacter pallidiroseus]RDC61962.1 hypothetical protein AHMF7616_00552 [Adhaeribacter pallidiroseus]